VKCNAMNIAILPECNSNNATMLPLFQSRVGRGLGPSMGWIELGRVEKSQFLCGLHGLG